MKKRMLTYLLICFALLLACGDGNSDDDDNRSNTQKGGGKVGSTCYNEDQVDCYEDIVVICTNRAWRKVEDCTSNNMVCKKPDAGKAYCDFACLRDEIVCENNIVYECREKVLVEIENCTQGEKNCVENKYQNDARCFSSEDKEKEDFLKQYLLHVCRIQVDCFVTDYDEVEECMEDLLSTPNITEAFYKEMCPKYESSRSKILINCLKNVSCEDVVEGEGKFCTDEIENACG